MSSHEHFVLLSAIEGFSLQPIVVATVSILKDLTPLSAADSSLAKDAAEGLKQVLECITSAVKCIWVMVRYFGIGIHGIRRTLENWEDEIPLMKLDGILTSIKQMRYAHANATDAQEAYVQATKGVASLMEKSMKSYGSDAVVEVESKNIVGQLNIRKSSIQSMGTNVLSHLEKSKTSTQTCIELLHDIDGMLAFFLEDEQASLTQPLAKIPVLAANPAEVWTLLNREVGSAESQLTGNISTNPAWFKWSLEDKNAYLEKDKQARKHLITEPTVRLQVPDIRDTSNQSPKGPLTPIPSQIIEAHIKPSGTCVIRLTSVERVKDGVSGLNFAVDISGSVSEALERIIIRCKRAADNAPVQLVDLGWKGIEDIPTSTKGWLRHSKPRLKTSVTQRKAEWTITRPIFYWRFIFPPSFTLSLNVVFQVKCILEAEVIFVYQGVFKRKRVSFDCSLRLPEGTTPTASKDP